MSFCFFLEEWCTIFAVVSPGLCALRRLSIFDVHGLLIQSAGNVKWAMARCVVMCSVQTITLSTSPLVPWSLIVDACPSSTFPWFFLRLRKSEISHTFGEVSFGFGMGWCCLSSWFGTERWEVSLVSDADRSGPQMKLVARILFAELVTHKNHGKNYYYKICKVKTKNSPSCCLLFLLLQRLTAQSYLVVVALPSWLFSIRGQRSRSKVRLLNERKLFGLECALSLFDKVWHRRSGKKCPSNENSMGNGPELQSRCILQCSLCQKNASPLLKCLISLPAAITLIHMTIIIVPKKRSTNNNLLWEKQMVSKPTSLILAAGSSTYPRLFGLVSYQSINESCQYLFLSFYCKFLLILEIWNVSN